MLINVLKKFTLALLTLFILNACNGEEDTPNPDSIIGTWEAVSSSGNVDATTTFNGISIEVLNEFEMSNLNYELTFTEEGFRAQGNYDFALSATIDGVSQIDTTFSITNVVGEGTYSIDGDVITFMGALFSFEANEIPEGLFEDEQSAKFEINSNGELVFTQEGLETTTVNQGATTTSIQSSTSVWRRK